MRFLADENFDGRVFDGIRVENPELDIVRAQDTEVYEKADPLVLEFAARENRILLTHDSKTMPNHAFDRLAAGLTMPGMIVVSKKLELKKVIEDILTLAGASEPEEWEGKVKRLPL